MAPCVTSLQCFVVESENLIGAQRSGRGSMVRQEYLVILLHEVANEIMARLL